MTDSDTPRTIYKILPIDLWAEAQRAGVFKGAAIDLRDGYIHFSTATQVAETARLHFAGQKDLVLVAVDGATLGPALKWEPSRGGALFPHLYATLNPKNIVWAKPMPLGPYGLHILPPMAP